MVEVCWMNDHEEVYAFDLFSAETCEKKRRPVAPFQSQRKLRMCNKPLFPRKWRHESIFSNWDVFGTGHKPQKHVFNENQSSLK